MMGSMRWLSVAVYLFLTTFQVQQGVAAPITHIQARDATPTALSTSATEQYLPYTYLAGACYCNLSGQWSCGSYCTSIPGFELNASGGDGGSNPYWYVGYAPSLSSIVVGHQGTNSSNALSILNDIEIVRSSLPTDLFPGVSSDVGVHSGFLSAMTKSASSVLSAVTSLLLSSGATKIAVVGHSLGAASATLSAIHLHLHVPSTVSIKVVGFAAPRVGNAAFATLTDTFISDFHHIANKEDPVPILPGRFLGYAHPNGEIHISDEETWYSCPGHDNTLEDCTIAAVPNLLESDVNDHGGPYVGVLIGSAACQ